MANNQTFDSDELIALLKVNNSKLEFENHPLGFSFPCCICVHQDKEQTCEPCAQCGHIN
ncbi:hypothetical protein [Vibrio sp. Hal054]|uniref:hypothetical protein n=1 Tax=Vibrio sp. Hal054 TaxID=3035158 RepID=UPI00301C5EBD